MSLFFLSSKYNPGLWVFWSLDDANMRHNFWDILYSKPPVIQFLLLRPKSCQEILSKPLTTGQDCTCCLATVTYRTFNQGDCDRHVLQFQSTVSCIRNATGKYLSGNLSVVSGKVGRKSTFFSNPVLTHNMSTQLWRKFYCCDEFHRHSVLVN